MLRIHKLIRFQLYFSPDCCETRFMPFKVHVFFFMNSCDCLKVSFMFDLWLYLSKSDLIPQCYNMALG